MSEDYKNTEPVADSFIKNNNNNNSKKEGLLRRKKRRISKLAFKDVNRDFDLGRIKNKLSKILEEEFR